MRFSRLVIGFLVIAAALWVIVTEQMAGASADAVLNAQVVLVRSPIAGTVADSDRGLGSSFQAGDTLATVTDTRVDSIHLNDLILQRDLADIRRATLLAKRTIVEQQQATLTDRSGQYGTFSLQEMQAHMVEAAERLRILSQDQAGGDAIRLSLAREEVARLQVALDAAGKGVFILGGYNDAPFAEQRGIELAQSIEELSAELDGAAAEIAAYDRRISLERIRVGRAEAAVIPAPVGGIVWERLAVTGSHVERGDALMRIADCDTAFVTLSVTQPVYNRLQVGSTANFRFDGSGEVMTGIVTRLGGSSAAGFYGSLAVAPSERHLERADVALSLPDLSAHPDLRCAIGRTGRAYFEVRPLDWLRSYFR